MSSLFRHSCAGTPPAAMFQSSQPCVPGTALQAGLPHALAAAARQRHLSCLTGCGLRGQAPLLRRASLCSRLAAKRGDSGSDSDSGTRRVLVVDRSADLGSGKYDEGVAFPIFPVGDRDPVKEGARVYRRTVFDFEKWREHRSTQRYTRHMASIPASRMVRGLAAPLFYILAISTAVALYNSSVEAGLLPDMLGELKTTSSGPFGATSFALSLLLVFRTNASYSRWLDARKTWGLLVNRSRDLTRQALTYFPPADQPLFDMMCRWTKAYSRSLMCHLREDGNFEEELSKVLLSYEVEAVLLSKHRPNYILQMMSEILRTAHRPTSPLEAFAGKDSVSAVGAFRMDENLSIFEDICGTCERILRSPIPLSYTRHTSRFMLVYLTLLPFSLWESVAWLSIPLSCIVAFLLLGIEEIGVSIEEPFSILPLEQICDTIEANIREMRSTHRPPAAAASSGSNGTGEAPPERPPSARNLLQRGVDGAQAEPLVVVMETKAAGAA